MTAHTYNDAYHLARSLAQAGDRAAADALMSRLLWHVEAANGGFMGLSDAQLAAKCAADPRLNFEAATAALWNPGHWPTATTNSTTIEGEAA